MARIMEMHRRQASPFERFGEIAIEGTWVNWRAISLGEHKPMVLVPWSQQGSHFRLPRSVLSQGNKTCFWDRHGTS
jgi:hypothetical protein